MQLWIVRAGERVSILAPLARGALRVSRMERVESRRVSILAPLARGALQYLLGNSFASGLFQSSPLLQEGRYGVEFERRERLDVFQSSPLLQEGRYADPANAALGEERFNPRPSCKRGATSVDADTEIVKWFQSSPLLQEGRYRRPAGMNVGGLVFQSSPLLQEGRYIRRVTKKRRCARFQSSPLLQEGRYASG